MAITKQNREQLHRRALPYVVAAAAMIGVTAAFLAVLDWAKAFPLVVALAHVSVITLVTVNWGVRPALLSALIGVLAFDYFFIHPLFQFSGNGLVYGAFITA